nr:MAG TPA: YopX protein [Caudoviricetes sp.]
MREILFVGKRTDNNEWICGSLKHTKIKDFDYYEIITLDNLQSATVKPETIRQFTGLTDKNGKKIFEGDIIKAYFQPQNFKNPPYAIGSVIFENGTFKVVVHVSKNSIEYKVFEKEDIAAYSIEHNFLDRYYVLEVIGNIHDNPELFGE